jgi:hypothetical protein
MTGQAKRAAEALSKPVGQHAIILHQSVDNDGRGTARLQAGDPMGSPTQLQPVPHAPANGGAPRREIRADRFAERHFRHARSTGEMKLEVNAFLPEGAAELQRIAPPTAGRMNFRREQKQSQSCPFPLNHVPLTPFLQKARKKVQILLSASPDRKIIQQPPITGFPHPLGLGGVPKQLCDPPR